MFTGIVEEIGRVLEVRPRAESRELVLAAAWPVTALGLGDSLAVDGVCLTLTRLEPGRLAADVGPETMARTNLGRLRPGARVHLERALALGARLGGHLVLGHVDGLGEVVGRRARGESLELEVAAPPEVRPYLVPKGSVAIDGVSLTLNEPQGGRFRVTLVPHTLACTTLGERRPGDPLNLEADILGKYVRHFLAPGVGQGGVDERLLRAHGFIPEGEP